MKLAIAFAIIAGLAYLWRRRYLPPADFKQSNDAVPVSFDQRCREWTCRREGCQASVPSGGYCPGKPQAHCYRCGKRTYNASKRCALWCEPIG